MYKRIAKTALKGPNWSSTPSGLAHSLCNCLRRLKPAATHRRPFQGLRSGLWPS